MKGKEEEKAPYRPRKLGRGYAGITAAWLFQGLIPHVMAPEKEKYVVSLIVKTPHEGQVLRLKTVIIEVQLHSSSVSWLSPFSSPARAIPLRACTALDMS
jgi:hypothetical protein